MNLLVSCFDSKTENVKTLKDYADEFIADNLKYFQYANKEVLSFIANFYYHGVPEVSPEVSGECIRSTFRAGYCYYFAEMLKLAFNRGTVCWCAPFGHIVWVDEDNIPYDIEGVNSSECAEYIPISYLGEAINSFKHVVDDENDVTDDFLFNVILKYREDVALKKQ